MWQSTSIVHSPLNAIIALLRKGSPCQYGTGEQIRTVGGHPSIPSIGANPRVVDVSPKLDARLSVLSLRPSNRSSDGPTIGSSYARRCANMPVAFLFGSAVERVAEKHPSLAFLPVEPNLSVRPEPVNYVSTRAELRLININGAERAH